METHDANGANAARKKIHLFHHSFQRGGGMESYALTLAANLKNLGHPVVFHARRADEALARSMGIELETLPVFRFPRKLQDFRFFRRVAQSAANYQGAKISLCRVRISDIAVCGGTHRGYIANARKIPGPFDWLQMWMEGQAYRNARTVVVHSDLCRGELETLYAIPPEKIVTLYPPVDPRFAPPINPQQRLEARLRLGLPSDQIILLFPSLGHSRKGLYPLYNALKTLSGRFILAVAGKPPRRATPPFVRYLGYLEDMAIAYHAADFTILGSSYEPFGMVGPESILCGTKLIFEEKIGCLSAIKSENVFSFSVWNTDSIRQAVQSAMESAQTGRHHIEHPGNALTYDASAATHAEAIARIALQH